MNPERHGIHDGWRQLSGPRRRAITQWLATFTDTSRLVTVELHDDGTVDVERQLLNEQGAPYIAEDTREIATEWIHYDRPAEPAPAEWWGEQAQLEFG